MVLRHANLCLVAFPAHACMLQLCFSLSNFRLTRRGLVAMSAGSFMTTMGVPSSASALGKAPPTPNLLPSEILVSKIFQSTSPSVVNIDTFKGGPAAIPDINIPLGTGSGIVWDKFGHVVTNFHVLRAGDPNNIAVVSEPVTSSTTATFLFSFSLLFFFLFFLFALQHHNHHYLRGILRFVRITRP